VLFFCSFCEKAPTIRERALFYGSKPYLTQLVIVEVLNAIVENKDSFKVKWLDGLKSEDALVRCRSKQFLKIIDETRVIKRFDAKLFIRMVEKFVADFEKKLVLDLLDGTEAEVEIK
jgi:site-specific DNA recombinase